MYAQGRGGSNITPPGNFPHPVGAPAAPSDQRRLGTVFVMCGSCSTPAAHALVRTRRWFTLFFIPIIPLGTKYFTTCALRPRHADHQGGRRPLHGLGPAAHGGFERRGGFKPSTCRCRRRGLARSARGGLHGVLGSRGGGVSNRDVVAAPDDARQEAGRAPPGRTQYPDAAMIDPLSLVPAMPPSLGASP